VPGGLLVTMAEGQDAREAIAALAVQRGWGLLEMRPLTLSLEEIFIRIVRGEAA
jgi:ABC-2 type transport system ATP-binding protein